METLRIPIFAVYSLGFSLAGGLGLGLHSRYRRGVRRYERLFDNICSQRFEQRTAVAKSVHPHLEQIIRRGKSVSVQARQRAADGPETTDTLNQVSEWLAGAAGESGRALRPLESGSAAAFNNGYIARGEHADTQTNSHHGR